MNRQTLGCMALFGWLMAASGSLEAHHSLAGVYDMKAEKELAGTVTTIKFSNPHGSPAIAVKNPAGSTTEWVLTFGSATAARPEGDWENRTECSPRRGQHHREVPPRKGHQSVGISQDRHHAGRARGPDLRR